MRHAFWTLMMATLLVCRIGSAAPATGAIWQEDFEGYADNAVLDGTNGWSMTKSPESPTAMVKAGVGINGGKALALRHTKSFRSDAYGLSRTLPESITGVAWLQCRFKPPAVWQSGFIFRTDKSNLSVGLTTSTNKEPARYRTVLDYWQGHRLQRELPQTDGWHTVTFKFDTTNRCFDAWFDGILLGSRIDTDDQPLTHLFLGAGGTPESPALIDELVISRDPPAGIKEKPVLPATQPGFLFRFAGCGDPQPGLGNYSHELYTFQRAIRQMNEAKPDLLVILGDLVHNGTNEAAYKDITDALKACRFPWHAARGNHDTPELFKKFFNPQTDYAFEHNGFRFVILDAIGGQAELRDEQLAFAEKEFKAAQEQKQEIVVCTHVSVWDNNARGASTYMQIGPKSKAQLKALFKQYGVLMMLSGHYHRGLWHQEEDGTHYLVLGGTGFAKGSPTGWSIFDVYPGRVVVYMKQLFAPYDDEEVTEFWDGPYQVWRSYKGQYPYLVQGPLVIQRQRPVGGVK